MKPKLSILAALACALLALTALLGTVDSAHATFNPSLEISIEDPSGGASSDFTAAFNLESGDVNFAALVAFIPAEWGVTPGEELPIGAVVGQLTAQATLGLINGACNNVLPVEFIMLNSSVDPNDTVDFLDTDDNGTSDYLEDLDNSGLPDAFEKYTDFATRVLVDQNDQPLTPIRRAAGITIVAGVNVLLQLLIFEPGTFIDEVLPNDEGIGYPTVILLQNAGDPDFDPVPGPITDFCSPLITLNATFGVSRDNGCTAAVPDDELDPLCEVTGVVLADEGVTTDPDEGGHTLFTNPGAGTYTFTTIAAGQRDADGDGYENALDTCPFAVNEGDPRIGSDGDFDNDGLDAACDPNDDPLAGGTNSDEDLDGFTNRQDNCPLVANGEDQDNQRDTDNDSIGDACDPDPDDADPQGELIIVEVTDDVTLGPGEPSTDTGGGGDGDDDDGGSSTLIIIIIAVIAGVVVIGGGALYLARRGGSGGATA